MQNYSEVKENWTLSSSLNPINNNFTTLLSQNAGRSFPVRGLKVGMPCYREDEKVLYVLIDVERELWIKVFDLTRTPVDKEYVDSVRVDLSRIDGLLGTDGKVKTALLNTGNSVGQVVTVGNGSKISTTLLDTGLNVGQLLKIPEGGKLPNDILNIGLQAGQIPVLDGSGKLQASMMPKDVAVFDAQGRLKFPNGNLLFIGG